MPINPGRFTAAAALLLPLLCTATAGDSAKAASPAKVVGAATVAKSAGHSPAATQAASSPGSEASFDSTRAFQYLKEQCSMGPRDPAGEGHARAIPYFIKHFRELGLTVARQDFEHTDKLNGKKVALSNIIVTVKGKDPKAKPVLFCAHWDSRPRAEQDPNPFFRDRPILGANDGASGVAVLMELANAFKARKPPRTVMLALFDGEDYGREGSLDEYFLGARYFADHVPAPAGGPAAAGSPKSFEYALLLDMIGDKDLYIPLERNSLAQSPDIYRKIFGRARELGLEEFMPMPGPEVWDDHMPLQEKGIPAMDLIDFDYPAWHTQGDTPDQCSARSLGIVGTLVTSLAYRGLR